MKKSLFSLFFALASLFAGSQAFAIECDGMNLKFVAENGQVFCSKEEGSFNDRNRANRYSGGNILVMPQQRQPVYVQQVPVVVQSIGQGQGSGLNNCQFYGGAFGGAVGSTVQNHTTQATIAGAVIGGLVADRIFCQQQAQPVPQGSSKTLVEQGSRPVTVVHPSKCSVVGNPKLQNLPLTEEQCDEVAATQTKKVVVSSEGKPSATQGSPNQLVFSNESTGSGLCRLLSNGTVRLKSNPGQTTSPGQVLAYSEATEDTGTVAVIPKKTANEDCTPWRHRAANEVVYKG